MTLLCYSKITVLPFHSSIIAIIAIALYSAPVASLQKQTSEPHIRVRLCKFLSSSQASFAVSTPEGMTIIDTSKKHKPFFFRGRRLYVTIKEGKFHLQGRKKECICNISSLLLVPKKKRFMVNGHLFSGNLRLVMDTDHRNPIFINILPLEEYLYALLPFEIYQFWPDEMQKVQAIASRTYAIYHLLHARKNNQLFDLKSTNFHQTYNGYHNYTHIKKAIEQTRGQTLHYDNKPALTMFDACCGGIIPAHTQSPHFRIAPFLARKKACRYCEGCSLFSWQKEVLLTDIIRSFGPIHTLSVGHKNKAGIVDTVLLKGKTGTSAISASEFAQRVPCNVWSHSFSLSRKKKNGSHYYVVRGNGFGHQLGLCQHGAHEMVSRGWNHKKILSFYYPETTLKKLYS